MAKKKKKEPKEREVQVSYPKFERIELWTVGLPGSPLVPHKKNPKLMKEYEKMQREGMRSTTRKKGDKKDFESLFEGAKYRSVQGWCGTAASQPRAAMVAAGWRFMKIFQTSTRVALNIIPDDIDADTSEPIIRVFGDVEMNIKPENNANGGMDLRARPMFKEWFARFIVEYDSGLFLEEDIANLAFRGCMQCGWGDGRPNSRNSNGCGWGRSRLASQEEVKVLRKKAEKILAKEAKSRKRK